MEQSEVAGEHVTVQATNIGGTEEATVDFQPGVTLLPEDAAEVDSQYQRISDV